MICQCQKVINRKVYVIQEIVYGIQEIAGKVILK